MSNFFVINDDQCNIPISTVDYMLLMSNIIVTKSKYQTLIVATLTNFLEEFSICRSCFLLS